MNGNDIAVVALVVRAGDEDVTRDRAIIMAENNGQTLLSLGFSPTCLRLGKLLSDWQEAAEAAGKNLSFINLSGLHSSSARIALENGLPAILPAAQEGVEAFEISTTTPKELIEAAKASVLGPRLKGCSQRPATEAEIDLLRQDGALSQPTSG